MGGHWPVHTQPRRPAPDPARCREKWGCWCAGTSLQRGCRAGQQLGVPTCLPPICWCPPAGSGGASRHRGRTWISATRGGPAPALPCRPLSSLQAPAGARGTGRAADCALMPVRVEEARSGRAQGGGHCVHGRPAWTQAAGGAGGQLVLPGGRGWSGEECPTLGASGTSRTQPASWRGPRNLCMCTRQCMCECVCACVSMC